MDDLKTYNSLNFIGALALYQQRRDSAIGLTHATAKQRGLLWFYNTKQQELIQSVSKAAFAQGALQRINQRMTEIMREVKKAKIKRKRELLIEAIQLEEIAKQWL